MASKTNPGTITTEAADRIRKIKQARTKGATSMKEIVAKTGLSMSAVRHATWLERHGEKPQPARRKKAEVSTAAPKTAKKTVAKR